MGRILLAISLLASCAAPVAQEPAAQAQALQTPGPELTEMVFDLAREGSAGGVREYLVSGYDPNAINARGDSLLIVAAYQGQTEVVKLLLQQKGIDLDLDNRMGWTALAGAAFQGNLALVRLLLDAGAKVDAAGSSGQTPLMFAALFGREEIAKLLVARGARPAAQDARGNDAETLARQQGLTDFADWLADSKR
jgi:ankyrin repeat protein